MSALNLFSTHDGSLSWTDEHPNGTIVRIGKACDGTIWSLERKDGDWTLWQVSIAPYRKWQKLGTWFPVAMDKADLVMADLKHVWLLYPDAANKLQLLATNDGGNSWHDLHSPCDDNPDGALVALDQQNLWLGCGRAGAGVWGSKYVFTSSDGGQTWTQKGRVGLPPQQGDTMPGSGYFRGLSALSTSFAYMTLGRVPSILITQDGGVTWKYSGLPRSLEFPHPVFIDPLHGWTFEQIWINRTGDGGQTWKCIELPENKPCL